MDLLVVSKYHSGPICGKLPAKYDPGFFRIYLGQRVFDSEAISSLESRLHSAHAAQLIDTDSYLVLVLFFSDMSLS